MSDLLHIIIAEDNSKTRRMLFSKRRLQIFFFLTVALFIVLSFASYNTFHFFNSSRSLDKQVQVLSKELEGNITAKDFLALQLQEVQDLHAKNSILVKQLQQEKAVLIHTAISELEERSSMIERIMGNIGVDLKDIPKKNANSGGPFISSGDSIGQDLLFRSNHYVDTINYIPLGRPMSGAVTSAFGHRTDPFNGKRAFHAGIDLKGRYGQKIIATADGVVTKSIVSGSYGHYIEINHGNGYTTIFAHMQKRLVKKGERVQRGQTIGTVGNSGRSTGPHLHYEICLHKKPLNPSKFMRVDKLLIAPVTKLRVQKKLKVKHKRIASNKASTPATSEN